MPNQQKQQTPIHRVSFRGTYSNGNNGVSPYRITIDVPQDVINNANAISWFKAQMRDTKSDAYKTFVEAYPDFAVLTTFAIDNLDEVTNVK